LKADEEWVDEIEDRHTLSGARAARQRATEAFQERARMANDKFRAELAARLRTEERLWEAQQEEAERRRRWARWGWKTLAVTVPVLYAMLWLLECSCFKTVH
jgi:hypothetical protein